MNQAPHPTVQVAVGDLAAPIDEEIAHIVEMLWQLGLATVFSCQDFNGRRTWRREPSTPRYQLMFHDVGSLEQFLELLDHSELSDQRFNPRWEYRLTVHRPGEPTSAEARGSIQMRGTVLIPSTDREALERVLGAAVASLT